MSTYSPLQPKTKVAGILFAVLLSLNLHGQTTLAPTAPPLDPTLQVTPLALWPDAPAGSSKAASTLTVFPPTLEASIGTAVIVAPGGGYRFLASNIEGRQVADWFASRGVTAFVLKYRLGAENIFPAPLEDMQRAIRLVRSLQKKYKFSAERIGLIGFSAGGHLAAVASTTFDSGDMASPDPVQQLSDKPNFVVLGYPAINAMTPQPDGTTGYCTILRISQTVCKDFGDRFAPASHVTPATPPTFIFSTSDDAVVSVEASTTYYSALQKAGVAAELHIFKHGAHGSGLGGADPALTLWPLLLDQWLRGLNLLTKPAPPTSPTAGD